MGYYTTSKEWWETRNSNKQTHRVRATQLLLQTNSHRVRNFRLRALCRRHKKSECAKKSVFVCRKLCVYLAKLCDHSQKSYGQKGKKIKIQKTTPFDFENQYINDRKIEILPETFFRKNSAKIRVLLSNPHMHHPTSSATTQQRWRREIPTTLLSEPST